MRDPHAPRQTENWPAPTGGRVTSCALDLPGIGPVAFRRTPRARRISIVLRPFREVRVSVPRGVNWEQAAAFVRSKRQWIREKLGRLREMEHELTARRQAAPAVDREAARRLLPARLAALALEHGFSYAGVTIRCQRSRWGSCSAGNRISLNLKLLALPPDLRDYVLLHELVHTRIKHHGPAFWAELEQVAGSARQKAARLRDYPLAGIAAAEEGKLLQNVNGQGKGA